MVSGIYLITNKINGHMYVGGSVDINRRFKQHQSGNNTDFPIDLAILKYGKENFTYQIITELPADWNVIGQHEKYWIKFYNTLKNPNHYNLTEGGEGISGWKHTLQAREKMSKNHADYSKENHPNWNKPMSDEQKRKISQSRIGKYGGENHPMWGEKHTTETKRKMSENHADFNGDKNPNYRHDVPSAQELLEEYESSDITERGLAKKYNCSRGLINKRLNKVRK